ncbi:MAG: hypothetical protein MZW92_33865 [Comamonadaceae bacterium]|nr:hypothetical protein [Comamonadaceae bacterium]
MSASPACAARSSSSNMAPAFTRLVALVPLPAVPGREGAEHQRPAPR